MKNYTKGFIGGILASVCMLIFVAATNQSNQYSQISQNELISKLEGIETTIPLHLRILDDPDFRAGNFSTAFLERFMVEAGADARGIES